MEILKEILSKYRRIFRYGINSIIVTIFDTIIVFLLFSYLGVNLIVSNSIGILVGFLIHYYISIKTVFAMESNRIAFIVYLGSSLIGLVVADYIILTFYEMLGFSLLLSKIASIVIPFFIIYNIRKTIYLYIQKEIK